MSKVLIIDFEGNQPLNLVRFETYSFNINVSPNRFYIQTSSGAYDSTNVYDEGVGGIGNGGSVGVLTFTPGLFTDSPLYYVCDGGASMGNQINIVDPTAPAQAVLFDDEEIPCYCKGTLILTNQGYVKIEDIKKNDLVIREGIITPSGTLERNVMVVPVIWISSFKVKTLNSKSRPICITKNEFGEHYPCEDLYISPAHKIFINDKLLLEANDIINGNTIYQDNECESVEYYHLECEDHSAIYANCILSESYIWRKDIFDGDKEIFDADK
jgi:hypothetical protein